MGITQYRLAKVIGVPRQRIGEIAADTRGVTVDTELRLSSFFGMFENMWIGLQLDHDAAVVKDSLAQRLARIKP